MPHHRLYLADEPTGAPPSASPPWTPGSIIAIEGEEARHALRVKRVEIGDPVELLDGRGNVAEGAVEPAPGSATHIGDPHPHKRERSLHVRIEQVHHREPVRPRLEVWAATPKGSRVDEMIDGLSQIGAALWSPLKTERGVVDPRDTKLERLRRVAAESSKQCGRAWLMEIGTAREFDEALAPAGPGSGIIVVADASGGPFEVSLAAHLRLLIGPEGGWAPGEIDRARRAGARIARFGPHTLRVETAAIAAAAIILDAERR